MSKTIDEKVVEMRFDNKHFQKHTVETMSTLDKLKQKLNLTGASKGLENVNKAANKVNMSGMSKAIDSVHSKFSALEVMGITALANITNSAVNAGKRIVSALTVDPIISGFREYETQINAVQTILANTESKGTTLQEVNRALDELNTYADKTIYNFTEMTRNIGTFTAAGVDLDTSVKSIQGIANLAAVSGSTSQQASTAMYQLSQALAAGKVSLMDWNSVVNAGMGGQVFQDALKRTAKAMGKNVDGMIKKYGSFRESLTKGEWLTTDVLTRTLEQFTMAAEEGTEQWENYKKSLRQQGYTEKQAIEILKMANTATNAATKVKTFTQLWDTLKESVQSGWTQTWEIIIGDFGEAKEFLTKISDSMGEIIGETADSRNKMLSGGLSTGWKQLLDAGIADEAGYRETLEKVAKENGFAFTELIKKTEEDGGTFNDALKKALTDGSITTDMLSTSVYKLSEKMQKMSVKQREAAGYTQEHIQQIKKLEEGLKNGSISMDEFKKKMMRSSGRENLIESLWNSFEALKSVIKPIKEAFRDIFPATTGEQLYELTERIRDFTSKLKISDETAKQLKNTFKGVFSAIDIGVEFIKSLARGISTIAKSIFGFSGDILDITEQLGNFVSGLRDSIKESNVFGRVIDGVSGFIARFITSLKDFGGSALSGIGKGISTVAKSILNTIGKLFGALGDAFQSGNLEKFMDLFNKGLISLVLLNLKKFINYLRDGGTLLDKIKGFFGSVEGVFENVSKVLDSVRSSLQAWQQNLKASILLKIASSVGILALAILVLSDLDEDKLKNSLSAITTLFFDLVIALKILSTGTLTGATKGIGMVIAMAISVSILAGALKKIADLSAGDLIKGILAVAVLSKIMTKVVNSIATESKKAIRGALGLIAFAAAIKILASVCKDLSTVGWEEMFRGLIGVGSLIGAVTLFTKYAKTDGKMISTALGLILLASALKILESSVKVFSQMKTEELVKGAGAVASLIIVFGIFSKLAGKSKGMISTGLSIVMISLALKQLVPVLQDLSNISPENLTKSVIAIAATLFILSKTFKSMGKGGIFGSLDNLMNAGALATIISMLDRMADAFKKFSELSWGDIGRSLVSVGVSLWVLIKATKAMSGQNEIALITCALGLLAIASAIKMLSGLGIIGIASGLLAFAGVFFILWAGGKLLKPLIPTLFKLAGAITAFAGAFALLGAGVFVLGAGLTSFVAGLVAAFLSFKLLDLPTIAKGLGTVIVSILAFGLVAKILRPVTSSMLALSGSMALLGLSTAAIGIGMSLLVSSFAALAAIGPEGAKAAGEALKTIITSALELIPIAVEQIGQGLISLLQVFAGMMPVIGEFVKNTVLMLVDVLITCAPNIAEGFLELIVSALKLLVQYVPVIVNLLADFIIKTLDVLSTRIPELVVSVVNFLGKLFESIMSAISSSGIDAITKAITAVGAMAALTYALSSIIGLIPSAMLGILGMGVLIAEMALVIAAIGGLAQIPGLSWLVEEGGNFLQKVGTAIGQFIGGIAGGILSGFTSNLPEVGANLSQFMTNLIPFIIGVKMIDGQVLTSIGILAGAITALTAASFLEAITSFFTGGSMLPQLGTDLSMFMTNAIPFIMLSKLIDPSVMTGIKSLAEAILILTANDLLTSLTSWFTGGNSLETFATQMPILGSGIRSFIDSIGPVSEDQVKIAQNAAEIIKTLATAAKEIPNTGGLLGQLVGNNDMGPWAEQLPLMAAGLAGFVKTISENGIKSDAIETAKTAAGIITSLATAAKEIPNSGGWLANLVGDNTLDKFAEGFPNVGKGIVGFVKAMTEGGITKDQLSVADTASGIITSLAAAAQLIPDSGGWLADLVGDNDLANFAEEMPNMGKGIKGFADELGTFGEAQLKSINAASTAIYAIAKLGDVGLDDINSDINSFGKKLANFGKKIKEFVDKVNESDANSIILVVKKVRLLIDLAKEVAGVNVESLKTFGDSLKKYAKEGVDGFVSEFSGDDPKKRAKEAVEAMVDSGIQGAVDKQDAVKDGFEIIAAAGVNATCSPTMLESASTAGLMLVQGFANGIKNNTDLASNAGSSLGKAALTAAKEALDSHSPSREAMKLGNDFDGGFVMGIEAMKSKVYDASYSVAEYARNGLSRAISKVSDLMSNGIDSQPTIRPVLDLSDVESGVGSISSMFNNGPSIGVAANLRAISSGMNARNQNGVNGDVISAINKLGKNLGNVKGGDTYNLNGITYDDGSNITDAVRTIVRAVKMERRV